MDSFIQPTISSLIDSKHSNIALSEREKFLSTYIRFQPCSLPDSIIYYISKNPSNSNVYEKMVQLCKYFFVQKPLLVVKNLYVKYERNQRYLYGKNVNLNRVSSKLWITDELRILNYTLIPSNSLTTILSKIYESDVKELIIRNQKIFITDLKFLASKCEKIDLDRSTVIKADGSVVGLEKIVEVFPKIKRFFYTLGTSQNVIKPKTVQKLIQIPHFSNLVDLSLREIPESFDIDIFYDYIKTNKKTKIFLNFGSQLSQQYQTRLQTIINEIIAIHNHEFKVPFIMFTGNDFSSSNLLLKLFMQI